MRSSTIRGGVAAASLAVVVLGYGFAPQLHAQQAAAVDPALAAKGAWDAGTTYAKDDIVTARGSAWISLRNSNLNKVPGQTQPSSATYWQLFARGFNPLGAWSNVTQYQPDDLVTRSGQTYRAKLTNTNKATTNTTYWELLAAKGAPGPNMGVAAGTLAAPAISFSGDANTGIYSPGTDQIALVEGGALFLHNIGFQNTALGLSALSSSAGNGNTALGWGTLSSNTSGADYNVAVGNAALNANTGGFSNVAVGAGALAINTTGYENAAFGFDALVSNTTGGLNVGLGGHALSGNTTGSSNTAVGDQALDANTTGSFNVAIGASAGHGATAPNNSIFIGNQGGPADTTTIKIGIQGMQDSAFIGGIRGTTTGQNNAVAVLVDSIGQLGTVSSSRRYKEDVETVPDVSAALMTLRPVTFRYKKPFADGAKPVQYGLIAEEVAEAMPYLAVFNDEGQPETVKYHELPTLLLAGWQAQQRTIAALEERLRRLEADLGEAKAAALH